MKKESKQTLLTFFKKNDVVLYPHVVKHYEFVTNDGRKKTSEELFVHLARSVVSQQLSTKAAENIWSRLEYVCKGSVTPGILLRKRMTTLRKVGLSGAKSKTLKELSRAVISGSIDFKKLRTMPEDEAISSLSRVWGIGTWTAEMFLMFALEREDVFSSGDLGLTRSMETLYAIKKDSPKIVYEQFATRWSPHRTIASRVLWRVRDTKSG